MPDTSVLVVGGSSVGLATALFLARQGVRTTLVERRSGVSIHPRALGLGLRAVEVLEDAGLTAALAKVQRPTGGATGRIDVERIVGADFSTVARRTPLTMTTDDFAAVTPATMGQVSQDRLDSVLLPAAREAGVTVRFDADVTSLEQDPDGVRVTLQDGEVIEAAYVVGCDGANSRVRELAGITRSGPGKLADGYVINTLFEADLSKWIPPMAFGMCGIHNEQVGGILISIDYPKRWLFHIMNSGIESMDDYPPERCAELIRAAIGAPELPVDVLSALPWRSSLWLADRFRAGRVFLAGDAAHVHPPTGGFGLNTGIPDGHNLAWKLALALQGVAGDALLDTYETERRSLARSSQEQVMLRARNMDVHWDGTKSAERAALGIAEFPVAQLAYPQISPAIVDPPRTDLADRADVAANLDGSPGTRVPHVWLDLDGERVSTVNLAGPEFALLTDGGHWPVWDLPLPLRTYDVSASRVPGMSAGGAMLVRPDGIVAWRGQRDGLDRAVAQAICRVPAAAG
ncbi:FAD-dependent monooxygenase [Fodinicola acaciae]|uniref:FAD-dependent monooxygenase n=1 Tax=Fodinicola acaciae TaxID=2681555 RepID=UPI0013D32AB2|nr:FAD-dependent monooxygenase [Fodinicola acaciae]